MKPTEDATIGRQRERDRKRVPDSDAETDRLRRAMTRRDRPSAPDEPAAVPDAPDLPSGWTRRRNGDDEITFVREGGELRLSATRENGAWHLSGRQRTGEAEHDFRVGGVSTRDEALRCLFDAMERVNAAMAECDWNGRICLSTAVDGVCRHDSGSIGRLVE
ncbi:hypothetical protein [Halostella litorea]|uniref:hypothetical protein n=1 Tax=Halostella litorea TaxID=2528831 RepID=UPI001092A757|nr:hypothetical protein [Halostella litorea]